jgi:outer membrane protein assembly factor BamB
MDSDGQAIYVTDDKGAVHALDINTGASIWKQDKLQLRGVTRPLVVGTHVAVADSKGLVHLLRRADGEFAARLVADSSGVRADLVRLSESSFLVQCVSGDLFALSVQ